MKKLSKRKPKKLQLPRQTLRYLDSVEIEVAVGGTGSASGFTCEKHY